MTNPKAGPSGCLKWKLPDICRMGQPPTRLVSSCFDEHVMFSLDDLSKEMLQKGRCCLLTNCFRVLELRGRSSAAWQLWLRSAKGNGSNSWSFPVDFFSDKKKGINSINSIHCHQIQLSLLMISTYLNHLSILRDRSRNPHFFHMFSVIGPPCRRTPSLPTPTSRPSWSCWGWTWRPSVAALTSGSSGSTAPQAGDLWATGVYKSFNYDIVGCYWMLLVLRNE